MRKVQYGLLVLVGFFSLTAGAEVLWQRQLRGSRTANGRQEAESGARVQLNMAITSNQSQCHSNLGIALVYAFQKSCRQPTPFNWLCDYYVTMSCER